MTDNKQKVGKPDRDRINMHEPYEVEGWCNHFGVTKQQLAAAVAAVGVMAKDVAKHLGKPL